MKRTINYQLLIIVMIAGFTVLTSCDKNDPTPEMTNTEKLSRDWVVVKFEVNGFDQTATFEALFPEYSVDFNSNGTYTELYLVSGTLVPVPGTWAFINNNTQIQMTDASQTRIYTIVYLSSESLKVDNAANADQDIYYLEPKP